ncbi:transporter [Salinicola sp. CPA57]|uniref:transporter n=1 Tax=Salinicola sp. CPA57 TaxID=1949080 RepID=UPI000DA25112|nr:transporter [Salinicola sp. CPA57]
MTPQLMSFHTAATTGFAFSFGAVAFADDQDLAKKLSNPVASLISVPFQLNYDEEVGAGNGERFQLNVQPVIPFGISEDWNLISRTIFPIVSQDDVVPTEGSQFGTGDTVQSLFFSPKAPADSGIIWGVGPVLLLPTASENTLGSEKWGLGPTGVVLRQSGHWTVGLLANHIWDYAGERDRADINSTFLQPFTSYTTPTAWTYTVNSESTYDWEASHWSAPVNFQITKLTSIGSQPFSVGGGLRYWVESPDDSGPDGWGVRLIATLLFPE